ncbi:M48 family metallopeptidase [Croceimicrobium hydrocarbonivorans]|uniref:M48 family metalloprotease n=1 Tax=Croceimicrobium hydrocarbonivorans TaxID=2761580 RepID=A0A7H0VBP4_9FLAO|nr:M48 family metallopeptidase [Croceimicrobium hydrocarbonivorans]QNR23142.1 M48 family metalloprotease [Croceimicrobium hydrocarbonivorans]
MKDLKTINTELRKKSLIAAFGLGLFFLSYLLLILFALGLAIGLTYVGVQLVIAFPRFITLLLAIAMIIVGPMIIAYLFKFLGKKAEDHKGVEIQVTEKDQPELFKLLKELTIKVNTSMPRKVFLVPEINAGVYFDSSFWSLFWPGRKNLKIGMGLLHATNRTELEFILAHEFGHFSQGSMMLGSYTYQVNQILTVLLSPDETPPKPEEYDNLGLISIGQRFGKTIIYAMSEILKGLYKLVNLSHSSLSRQMEFHADAVAASIYGPKPLKHSFNRTEFMENCFSLMGNFYNRYPGNQYSPKNLYRDLEIVKKVLCEEYAIPEHNGQPYIRPTEKFKPIKSQISFYENWNSHPEHEERIASLEALFGKQEFPKPNPETAFKILLNPTKLEEELSLEILKADAEEQSPLKDSLNAEEFEKAFKDLWKQQVYHPVFNHYYDQWNPEPFDLDLAAKTEINIEAESLFQIEIVNSIHDCLSISEDLNILAHISAKGIDVKRFRYKDRQYKRLECGKLSMELQKEQGDLVHKIAKNDQRIYSYCLEREKQLNKEPRLQEMYQNWFKFLKPQEQDQDQPLAARIMAKMAFIEQVTPYETIEKNFKNLIPLEQEFRKELAKQLENKRLCQTLGEEILESLRAYLTAKAEYFKGEKYLDDNLQLFIKALQYSLHIILPELFQNCKVDVLEYQASLLPHELCLEAEKKQKEPIPIED